jgi:hypothetical protein
LKGRGGKHNVIIKREFNRDDKKSIWYMNGERTTGQKVSDTVADLGIQIGNLCAFLPQDKVAEFAQMNPKELLRATMGAAGDPNLTRWHDILVNNAGKLQTFLQVGGILCVELFISTDTQLNSGTSNATNSTTGPGASG